MSGGITFGSDGSSAASAFGSFAEKYERGTGGATRHIARRLVSMSPPFSHGSIVLDNACGTGIVTEEIQRHVSSTYKGSDRDVSIKVIGADPAAPMVEVFQQKSKHAKANAAWPNVASLSLHTVAAEDLNEAIAPSNSVTHSYMNFGLFFCTNPAKAAEHVYRSLAPGGTAYLTCWADLGYLNAMQKVEKECNPDNPTLELPFGHKWEDPAYIKDVLHKSGFSEQNVKVVQEDSFYRAENLNEVARLLAELFLVLKGNSTGWSSEDAKSNWTTKLAEYLAEDEHFITDENGVAIRMLANVAICKK